MKKMFLGLLCLLCLSGCSLQDVLQLGKPEANQSGISGIVESDKALSVLEAMDLLAKQSTSTGKINVSEIMTVSKDADIKPGIYDLEVLDGFGTFRGQRASKLAPYLIPWAVADSSRDSGFPSKVRLILFEGDTLEFSGISSIQLTAVHKPNSSIGLAVGIYVVGRDISAGSYKVTSSPAINSKNAPLSWRIALYDYQTNRSNIEILDSANDQVELVLEEGQVITTSFTSNLEDSSENYNRLIFTRQFSK